MELPNMGIMYIQQYYQQYCSCMHVQIRQGIYLINIISNEWNEFKYQVFMHDIPFCIPNIALQEIKSTCNVTDVLELY